MNNFEKNEKNFKKMYYYYTERVKNVVYPKEELENCNEKELKKRRIEMLKLKYIHSKRVVEAIKRINDESKNELLNELVYTSGLLHDYGRFIQAIYHDSYLEAEKFYKSHGYNGHGEVGYKLLFEFNEIKNFNIDENYYELLGPVIKYHQVNKLEEKYDQKIDNDFYKLRKEDINNNKNLIISFMLQMVRDADIYDILHQRITGEYPILSEKFKYHINNKSIEQIEKETQISKDEIIKINKLDKRNIKDLNILLMPLNKVNISLLEVPEKIKEKFYNKIYFYDKNEWDLYKMQNDNSYNYNSITAMWWTIGQFLSNINFTNTLKMIKEEKILETIYSLYPDKYKPLVKDMFEFSIKELLNNRINQDKIYVKK